MNRLSLVLISSLAFMFAACGDSGNGASPQGNAEGTLTDSRDGQTYKIVTIGSQTWMAQNLNYKTDNSYCYDDETSNCTKYGRLYTWSSANTACPTGWHLPTKAEFETLFTVVGGSSTAGTKLKSTTGWISIGNSVSCTDAYSFSALPAGGRYYNGDYLGEGYGAYFWSSSEDYSYGAYYMYLYCGSDDARLDDDGKGNGFSVRCVKD